MTSDCSLRGLHRPVESKGGKKYSNVLAGLAHDHVFPVSRGSRPLRGSGPKSPRSRTTASTPRPGRHVAPRQGHWRPLSVPSSLLAGIKALARDRDRLLETRQAVEGQLRMNSARSTCQKRAAATGPSRGVAGIPCQASTMKGTDRPTQCGPKALPAAHAAAHKRAGHERNGPFVALDTASRSARSGQSRIYRNGIS